MIRVKRPPPPADLISPGASAIDETDRAITFYAVAANRDKSFTFRAYKHPIVGPTLTAAFAGKCAYCESSYEATAPVDVEHYRPKGAIAVNGVAQRPGYYWLAADWNNLLPSCIDCNRERTQHFGDGGSRLSGKANKFPIGSETKRAAAPGEERHEARLLLHPYRDHPERHLEFMSDGIVRARRGKRATSAKGRVTIDTVGLQRDGLGRARAARATLLQTRITQARRWSDEAAANPGGAADVSLREVLTELKEACEPRSPYSAMARQLVRAGLGID